MNVQHNCIDNKCTLENSRRIFQEREKIHAMAPEVKHRNTQSSNFILNLGQMRDAARIAAFRQRPPILNRNEIIQLGALREAERAKQQRKQQTADAVKNSKATTRTKGKATDHSNSNSEVSQLVPTPEYCISQTSRHFLQPSNLSSMSLMHYGSFPSPTSAFATRNPPMSSQPVIDTRYFHTAHPSPLLSDPNLARFRHFPNQ